MFLLLPTHSSFLLWQAMEYITHSETVEDGMGSLGALQWNLCHERLTYLMLSLYLLKDEIHKFYSLIPHISSSG
jgi:hypothetical protein